MAALLVGFVGYRFAPKKSFCLEAGRWQHQALHIGVQPGSSMRLPEDSTAYIQIIATYSWYVRDDGNH